jgi:hypothetical protein
MSARASLQDPRKAVLTPTLGGRDADVVPVDVCLLLGSFGGDEITGQ